MPDRLLVARLATILALVPFAAHGHGSQHEAAARPAYQQVGVVQFENSAKRRAQVDLQYGIAQLHNFEYADAAAAFRRVQKLDPGYALAYWGEAMSHNHTIWMEQDAAAARAALAKLAPDRESRLARARTERERAYLDAVEILYGDGSKRERDRRYAAAMARLHARWPDDIDATAFYALALLGTAHDGRDVATYMKSYALVADLFPRYPQHPGLAHYLIHSVDDAAHAPLGVAAARAYGSIAPQSPHALHMTSHIYLALGQWDAVVAANEAALAVSGQRMRAQGGEPARCGHAITWLAYGYQQQGRFDDSRRLIETCLRDVRERPMQVDDDTQFDLDNSTLATFYAMRHRYLQESVGNADQVAGWLPDPAAVPLAEFRRHYTTALLAALGGDAQAARDAAAALQAPRQRLAAEMDRFQLPVLNPYRVVLAIESGQVAAMVAYGQGGLDAALPQLETLALEEDRLPAAFGPPQIEYPTRELLGRLLLRAGRPVEARVQFDKALQLNPGRLTARHGLLRALRAAGDRGEATAVEILLQESLARADAGVREKLLSPP